MRTLRLRIARAVSRRIARALGREEGHASLEFVILFPMFILHMLVGIEAGLMMTRQAMLERGVDIAMRDLRLGTWEDPTHQQLRERICENSVVVPRCLENLMLELAPIDTANWAMPPQPPACIDRVEEIEPVTVFVPGAGNQMMMVRACLVIDPLFPTTPLGLRLPLDASGGFQMTSASAFVNEPR